MAVCPSPQPPQPWLPALHTLMFLFQDAAPHKSGQLCFSGQELGLDTSALNIFQPKLVPSHPNEHYSNVGVNYFPACCDKIPEKGNLKDEGFISATIQGDAVHHGRQGMEAGAWTAWSVYRVVPSTVRVGLPTHHGGTCCPTVSPAATVANHSSRGLNALAYPILMVTLT